MLSSAISTVLTPAFRLLLFCLTAFRSSVMVSPVPVPVLADQPSLPVAVVADRLEGLHLDQRTRKALIILGPDQLSIQPRRAGFERVLGARNQVFHIQQHAEIPAESCAILVRDAGELLDLELARLRLLNQPLRKEFVPFSVLRLRWPP